MRKLRISTVRESSIVSRNGYTTCGYCVTFFHTLIYCFSQLAKVMIFPPPRPPCRRLGLWGGVVTNIWGLYYQLKLTTKKSPDTISTYYISILPGDWGGERDHPRFSYGYGSFPGLFTVLIELSNVFKTVF